VLTWTVTPDVLHGHADVCRPGRWPRPARLRADAPPASEDDDPMPALDELGVTRLRAVRRTSGVPVVLTAAVMPPGV
jgi:hypothetical protein